MALLFVAFLAGVLTIATPCIFPILPFVLARADQPFWRGGLPVLVGLALTFAAVASLAAVAGGWVVEANRYGRAAALAAMTVFGLTMLLPSLAVRMTVPIVSLGSRMAGTGASSLLLGVATGMVWAPCAGPVLGLILTGAALGGPSLGTSVLLLAYGLGAATSLAAGVFVGGRLLAAIRRSICWGDCLRRLLGAAVVAGAACIWLGLDTGALTRWSSVTAERLERNLIVLLPKESALASVSELPGPLASLLGARQWLNTPPLRPNDLRGKPVLVNFWTYSCINCLRVLPHVRAWADRYSDRGLVVIGVHTPEFAFEKDVANVEKALRAQGVSYPVAVDSDFGIWRAFGNQAWPALYFIGADGRIRHRVLGEGGYAESEQMIQRLLAETDGAATAGTIASVTGDGVQAEASAADLHSGETYIGYDRATGFASFVRPDVPAVYRTPPALPLNRWSLAGRWNIGGEFASLEDLSGRIAYRFHARDLHLVLAPSVPNHPIRFRITLDGGPPGDDHGVDVDADGWGSVRDGRLYQLVRQMGAVADRTFEIEFFDAGVRAYGFTFG